MNILVNELSIHEQFHSLSSFRDALRKLISLRRVAQRFGRDIHCHRLFLQTRPIRDTSMHQAISNLADKNEIRAVLIWLTRTGPFWEDFRRHTEEEYLECKCESVTESAVGEAAFQQMHNMNCGLVSICPSDWTFTPVEVKWTRESDEETKEIVELENWWSAVALETALSARPTKIRSWDELQKFSEKCYAHLYFAGDCFDNLKRMPFATASEKRINELFSVLDKLVSETDESGSRSKEGTRLYQEYCVGDNARISDSSVSEKARFRNEMTFPHPETPSKTLFCTWHGKVRHLNLRIHFSWPQTPRQPIYVVYVGPKITQA